MVVPVLHLGQRVARKAVHLVAVQAGLLSRVLAARVDQGDKRNAMAKLEADQARQRAEISPLEMTPSAERPEKLQ